MSPRGFVIHFTARSGSTFIIYTLMRHPRIKAHAEVFGGDRLPGNLEQTDQNQIVYFRRLMRPYRIEAPLGDDISRGFKIQVAREHEQIRNVRRYVKVAKEYDVAKLFLYRKNRVKQVISALRARQVQDLTMQLNSVARAHVFDSETHEQVRKLPKLVVRPERLLHALDSLEEGYRTLDSLKADFGGGIDLFYEDVIADRQRFFEKIFQELGVPSIDVSVTDETKKITSELLSDVVENFDELKARLSGTVYEAQLTSAVG